MVCYNCQDEGYMSRECSKPCSLCSATDHTSATCEKKGEKRKDPPAQGKDAKNDYMTWRVMSGLLYQRKCD
jgi:hypothetical protein